MVSVDSGLPTSRDQEGPDVPVVGTAPSEMEGAGPAGALTEVLAHVEDRWPERGRTPVEIVAIVWRSGGLARVYEDLSERCSRSLGHPIAALTWTTSSGEPVGIFFRGVLRAYLPPGLGRSKDIVERSRRSLLGWEEATRLASAMMESRDGIVQTMVWTDIITANLRGNADLWVDVPRSRDVQISLANRLAELQRAGELGPVQLSNEDEQTDLARRLMARQFGPFTLPALRALLQGRADEYQEDLREAWSPFLAAEGDSAVDAVQEVVERLVALDCDLTAVDERWTEAWNDIQRSETREQGPLSRWIAHRSQSLTVGLVSPDLPNSMTACPDLFSRGTPRRDDTQMAEELHPPLSEPIEDRLAHVARASNLKARMAGKNAYTEVRAEVLRGACWVGLSHPQSRLGLAVAMAVALAIPQAIEATAEWRGTSTAKRGIPPQGRHPEVRTAYSIASRILTSSTIMIVTVSGGHGGGALDTVSSTTAAEPVRHRGVRGLRDGEVSAALRAQADVMLRRVLDALGQVFLRWVWRRLHFDEFVGNPVGGQEKLGAYYSTQAWNMATRLSSGRWRLPDQLARWDRHNEDERVPSAQRAILELLGSRPGQHQNVRDLLQRLADVGKGVLSDEDPKVIEAWRNLNEAADDEMKALLDTVGPGELIDWILRNTR